jgi:sn1-specific diacylglycerol lipase
MPALYVLNRRTLLGGDDLQLPAVGSILFRVLQLMLLVVPLSYQLWIDAQQSGGILAYLLTDPATDECSDSHFFPLLTVLYLSATVLFLFFSMLLEYQVYLWACEGTITDTQPRSRHLENLLEIRLVVFTVLQALICLTAVVAVMFSPIYLRCKDIIDPTSMVDTNTDTNTNDNNDPYDYTKNNRVGTRTWWIGFGLLLLTQLGEILVSLAFLTQLLCKPSNPSDNHPHHHHHHDHHELVEELWADRCHWLCSCLGFSTCFLFGGRDLVTGGNGSSNYYEHVARALADYLETRGVLDVVPTDLVTGLLVVQRLQRQRMLQARVRVVRSSVDQRQQSQSAPFAQTVQRPTMTTISTTPSNFSPSTTLRSRTSFVSDDVIKTTKTSSLTSTSVSPETALLAAENNATEADTLEEKKRHARTRPILLNMGGTPTRNKNIYRRQEKDENVPYTRKSRQVLNPTTDSWILHEGARFAKYALAIYTWKLYAYVHPITGIPRLICRHCAMCRRNVMRPSSTTPVPETTDDVESNLLLLDTADESTCRGDTICEWHKHSLLLTAGLTDNDLVYAQLTNSFSWVPYCILLDHATTSLVVSVRGTLSLEDLVTDVVMDPENLEALGQEFGFDAADQYCHGGVVACARNLYQDLQRHSILERLLLGETAQYPNYTLRLVGHSLGASTCTLLSYMLKRTHPTLRVHNYSPPGCTMTWELATQCQAWTTTFCLDSDLVPRLSVDSLEVLRDEILDLIGRIKVPKYKVAQAFVTGNTSILSATLPFYCCCPSGDHGEKDLEELRQWEGEILYPPDVTPPPTRYQRQLHEFQRIQQERKTSRGNSRQIKLYPPGKMIHLVKTGEESGCCTGLAKCATCCTSNVGFSYTPVWIGNDDLDEIVVSPTMGTDHFVNRICNELEGVARDFGVYGLDL